MLFICEAQADISYSPAYRNGEGAVVAKVIIHGEIKKGDAEQFRIQKDAALASAKSIGISIEGSAPFLVELDSYGGSVAVAIEIGKEIREIKPVSVNVSTPASCVSACVFILAGGTSRLVDGKVGIHRPYIDIDTAFTAESQKSRYAEIEAMAKDYLSFVNVPLTLYDVMFRIPPEKVRYLSSSELQEFNLSEDDPYFKEARDAKQANDLGISKSEYQRQVENCSQLPSEKAVSDCFENLINHQ